MSNSVQDDISYLRNLAEAGRNRPILGGAAQAAAGVVYGLACIFQWAILKGYVPFGDSRNTHTILWTLAPALVAVLTAIFYSGAKRKLAQAGGGANTWSYGMAWTGCGIGIVVAIADLGLFAYKMQLIAVVYAIPPVAFAFYGAAWCVAAAVTKRPWMYLASAAAFTASIAMALLPASIALLLVVGLALLICLALPGFKLMTDETR